MSIASFVAVLVVLCWSGASAQGRTPVLSGGAVSFLSASGTSVVGFSLVNTEPGAGTRIPANLEIPAALRSDVARMIRSSPTFRRQCARIAEAAARIVVLVMPASDRRLTRSHAASSIDRDNGQLAATVILGSPNLRDQSEYLAHEIEHVLEQIEGVDLTSAVAKGVRGARRIDGVDENGSGRDIYLVQIRSGDVSRVSIDSKGRQAAVGESIAPTLSGDGGVVAFGSTAPIGQSSAHPHSSTLAVFVRDLPLGRTTCVSCRGESSVTAGQAFGAHLSGDGRFLAFTLQTDHGPLPRRTDIVVRDLTTAAATVVTNFANGPSTRPKLSGDGRFVVFESQASNLVCQSRCAKGELDVNLLSDIYMLDQRTGRFARVSGGPEQWWFPSIAPSIDASGCVVAFSSRQPFGPEDPTTDFDLFVRMCDEATPGARTAVVRTDRTGAERVVTSVGFTARLPRPAESSSLFGHADRCRVTAWCV